jgi:hypothetical protein
LGRITHSSTTLVVSAPKKMSITFTAKGTGIYSAAAFFSALALIAAHTR